MPVTNAAIVILGASGDLAHRKLIPALSMLYAEGEIDDSIRIIGSGRSEFSDDEFRDKFELEGKFRELLHYHAGMDGLKSYVDSKGSFDRIIPAPSKYAPRFSTPILSKALICMDSIKPAFQTG